MNHGEGTDVYLQVAEAVAVGKAAKAILHRYAYIQIARHTFDILCARIIHRSYCHYAWMCNPGMKAFLLSLL